MKKASTPKALLEMAAYLIEVAHHDTGAFREELLINSTALQVVEDGLTAYIQRQKSQIEGATDPKELEPKVTTVSCSIGERELEEVDVTLWFALASNEDLRVLHEGAYGEGPTTESMIHFLAFFNLQVEYLLSIADCPEVVCQINEKEAKAWIVAHRPHILS